MKLTLFFSIFWPLFLFSQNSVSDFSELKIVRNHILLTLNSDSSLGYIIDDNLKYRYNKLENNQVFLAKNNDFHIRMKYINPLHYQITTSNKVIDDNLFNDTDKYISNIVMFIGSLTRTGPGMQVIPEQSGSFSASDPNILDIYIRLHSVYGVDDIPEPLLNTLMALKIQEMRNQSIDTIRNAFKALYNITEFSQIKAVSEKNDSKLQQIESKFKALGDSISKFELMVQMLAPENTNTPEYQWLRLGLESLKNKYNEIKIELKDAKDKYLKVKSMIESTKVEDGELNIADLKINENKRFYEVEILIKELDFDFDKLILIVKEEKKHIIRVRKFQRIIPSVSTGAIFSELKFKSYGTDQNSNGETIITEANDLLDPLNFGTYMNLQINNTSEIIPLLQFGISTTKHKPALMLGIGGSYRNLNVSIGGLWTWVPQLSTLSVGQVVTGTSQIDEDIKYYFQDKPYFYIGLNVNIIKNN